MSVHTFTLTNDGNWHQYVYPFTGTDTAASAQTAMVFTLTGSNQAAETGATIYVDDIYLGKTTTSATGFRSEVMTTLQAINPGSLRYANYQQLGTNDSGYEGTSGCTPGNSSPSTTGTCDYQHGPAYINGSGGTWTFAGADTYPLANSSGRSALHDARQCDERCRPQEFRRQSLHGGDQQQFLVGVGGSEQRELE